MNGIIYLPIEDSTNWNKKYKNEIVRHFISLATVS